MCCAGICVVGVGRGSGRTVPSGEGGAGQEETGWEGEREGERRVRWKREGEPEREDRERKAWTSGRGGAEGERESGGEGQREGEGDRKGEDREWEGRMTGNRKGREGAGEITTSGMDGERGKRGRGRDTCAFRPGYQIAGDPGSFTALSSGGKDSWLHTARKATSRSRASTLPPAFPRQESVFHVHCHT